MKITDMVILIAPTGDGGDRSRALHRGEDSMGLNAHSVAHLFPPMSDTQYTALREDIRENGQREPITLWRGQVIDGLHRAKACEELGREPLTRNWEGEEAALTGYVVSLNLHRRHLNESQRAMVAEKIAMTVHDAGQLFNAREAVRRGSPSVPIDTGGRVTREEAATLLNVGEASVGRARLVRTHGVPDLVKAVESGDLSLNAASHVAKLPESEQRAALAAPRAHNPHLNKHPTRAVGERVHRTVESLVNLSEVLVESLPSMNGDKRRAEWAGRLRDVRTTLTRFIVECERE